MTGAQVHSAAQRKAIGFRATVTTKLRFDPRVIGKRVRDARRERAKLTTAQLADRTAIGLDSLYKKQRGIQPFYLEELSRVCDVLGAPTLFPFLEWEAAALVDKILDRASSQP
jgi:hypothetical protein